MATKARCKWCNINNALYVDYHDNEWCKPNFDDKYLFEMLILEGFQSGLSWECVLNKRESFRKAYENFDINKVILFDDAKIDELSSNKSIIRNRRKIAASISNSRIFKDIVDEFGSFYCYLKGFSNKRTIYETDRITNEMSDNIAKDLKCRGMRFMGSVTVYSYLQAVGFVYSHDKKLLLI